MIKVNNYNSLSFIKWAQKTHQYNFGENNEYQLRKMVDEYLTYKNQKWNLKFFIKLFQDYVVVNLEILEYGDYIQLLEEFCGDYYNICYVNIETIDKQPYLQPLFQEFINYLKQEGLYTVLNERIINISKGLCGSKTDIISWFSYVISIEGKNILENFKIYMGNSINTLYIDEFENWIENQRGKFIEQYKEKEIENFYRENRIENIIQAVYQTRPNILSGNYRKKCMCYSINKIKESDYSLDFLKYIDNKGFKLEKSIPNNSIDELIDEYCETTEDVNRKKLKKAINNILKDKISLIDLIKNNHKESSMDFTLERYYECKNHGILLFEANGKLSDFLKKYEPDLHSLTGKYLNIYYTNEDLKKYISAYERIKKLTYLKVKRKEIPCILLWQLNNDEVKNISLDELNHEEIFKIIKKLAIELEYNSFEESIYLSQKEADKIRDSKKLPSKYELHNCKIGAIGDGAIAVNTKF